VPPRPRLVVAPLVALALAAGAGARPSAAPTPAALLARYVPILVLHPSEQVAPAPVDGFLADADLERRSTSGWEPAAGPVPAGGADLRLDQRACAAIDGPAATPCYAASEARHPARPVVYGAALRRGSRIELQYWVWYAWDVYSPTVPPGELWQVHEGDWEAVAVVVAATTGRPLVVGFSQHGEGVTRDWSRVQKQGTRPLAYVALGSHANYPTPGVHPFDARVVDALLISVIRQNGQAPVDHTGRGRIVRPRLVPVTATTPTWMAFAGGWGEDGYLRVPGGLPQPYSGTGPKGPASHEQWRRPVAEVMSWPRG
jgi:Vacuolar protein sorting-associated protein 62